MASTMDLNFRLMCKDCRKNPPNIVEDHRAGDLICGDCGLVFPMRIIDTTSEWRNFAKDDKNTRGDDPSRVGAAENPLMEGIGDHLTTTISKNDGMTGQSSVLSKAMHKVSGSVRGDRDIVASFRDIGIMCERIGLPRIVADRAKHIYRKVFDDDHAKGKPNEGIIAACIFIACNLRIISCQVESCFIHMVGRQERVSRTFKEITALTRIDKKVIGKCFKAIAPLIQDREVHTIAIEDYVTRFCSHLDLPMPIRTAAAHVVQKATEHGIMAGRSPLTIAAAAIYLISQLVGNTPKSYRDIAPVAGVSDSTIRGGYRDLWAERNLVLPDELKEKAKLLPQPGYVDRTGERA